MTASAESPPRVAGATAWWTAAVLCFAHVVSFLDRAIVIVTMAPLKAEFGLSDVALGALYGTAFVVLYGVAALPLGWAADRTNRRGLIIVGILIWTFCTIWFGLAESVPALFAARVGVGLGEACLVPAAMSLLGDVFPRERLGKAVGVFAMGPSLGISIAFVGGGAAYALLDPLGGLTLEGAGRLEPWRVLFLLAAIPGLIGAILILTIREPVRRAARQAAGQAGAVWSHFLKHRVAYSSYFGAAALYILIIQAITAWTPAYFVRAFDLAIGDVSIVVGVATAIVTPTASLIGGGMLDRLERKGAVSGSANMLALSIVLGAPMLIVVLLVSVYGPIASGAALAIGMLALGCATPALLAGVQLMTPAAGRGLATATFMMAITFIGVGGGPPLAGYLAESVFHGPVALAWSLAAVTLGSGVVALTLAWRFRRAFRQAAADADDGGRR